MPRLMDFSAVKSFEPVPADTYEATLTEVEYVEKTLTSKGDYIKLVFTISDGEYQGRKLFRNMSMLENSLWAFKNAMIALGTDPSAFDGELDPEEVARENVGNDCQLDVVVKQVSGQNDPEKKTNEIRNIKDAAFA